MTSKYCNWVKSCKHSWWCADDYNPKRDNHKCFIPYTNADRIRSMSDEELAIWHEQYCPNREDNMECQKESCAKCWFDWLKEEWIND